MSLPALLLTIYLTIFGVASVFCTIGLIDAVTSHRPKDVRDTLRWWLTAVAWLVVAVWFVVRFIQTTIRLARTPDEEPVDPEVAAEVEDALRRKP